MATGSGVAYRKATARIHFYSSIARLVLSLSQVVYKSWLDSCPKVCFNSLAVCSISDLSQLLLSFSPLPFPLGPSPSPRPPHLYRCYGSPLSSPSCHTELSSTGELRHFCSECLWWLPHRLQRLWLLSLAFQTPCFGVPRGLCYFLYKYAHVQSVPISVTPWDCPWTFSCCVFIHVALGHPLSPFHPLPTPSFIKTS